MAAEGGDKRINKMARRHHNVNPQPLTALPLPLPVHFLFGRGAITTEASTLVWVWLCKACSQHVFAKDSQMGECLRRERCTEQEETSRTREECKPEMVLGDKEDVDSQECVSW